MNLRESAISIIHHGRDRERLLPLIWGTKANQELLGHMLPFRDEFLLSCRALFTLDKLTPKDDTKIRTASILKYLDVDKADGPEFLYTLDEIQEAVSRVWEQPPDIEDDIRHWLLARGVTPSQLADFRSFRQVQERRDRIVLGIEIHPAIQRWIGETWPRGVAFRGMHHLGCHLRFFSTVPKIKFGAACPLVFVSSNIDKLGPDREDRDIWLVEGLFDGLALDSLGLAYMSPSSGTWSAEQLNILISTLRRERPAVVHLAHDRDRVGLKENLFLWSVMKDEFNVQLFLYPDGVKDMAELVCKHHLDLRGFGPADQVKVAELYLACHYEPLVDFDLYLDHRNTAYSNDRYLWNLVS